MDGTFTGTVSLILASNLLHQEVAYCLSRHGRRLGLTSEELLVLSI